MDVLTILILIFALLGALDRILGNKFGLGKEFERGFQLLGTMALSTMGMLIIAPLLIMYTFCQKYLVQGIERSGLVG